MKKRQVYITNYDKARLNELIAQYLPDQTDPDTQKLIDRLDGKIRRAKTVLWKEINPNIVTVNSTVKLKNLHDNQTLHYSLVFPKYANINRNKISVLSHLGISLLGCKVNDTIKLRLPHAVQRFVISSVIYQPEANDRYD